MPNVLSHIAPAKHYSATPHQANPILDIAIRQISSLSFSLDTPDLLSIFPTEIRLMIFAELLSVWPHVVFRGAKDFGPLHEQEFTQEIPIPWQILATCKKYYEEAMPIMYSQNRFVFCTGKAGEPGQFWRFPIHTRYMGYLTDLGIYLRADTPNKEAARRVAHFLKAITRRAVNLEALVVLVSSDCLYEKACPWDVMFCDHPVAKALVQLIEAKTIKHLKIRMHDYGFLYPGFAHFLTQTFYKDGVPANRSIAFTRSCSCPPDEFALVPNPWCMHCTWLKEAAADKPVDFLIDPAGAECDMERMMDMQHNLFQLGILPLKEDGEDEGAEDEVEKNPGPYGGGPPIEDDYEEKRKAFTAGMLLPGQVRRYKGVVAAPRVWSFEQAKLTFYFKVAA